MIISHGAGSYAFGIRYGSAALPSPLCQWGQCPELPVISAVVNRRSDGPARTLAKSSTLKEAGFVPPPSGKVAVKELEFPVNRLPV